ncbi:MULTISPECIES: TVP38/TMEM64 family protein [Aequorivita]|uniref:TVP38/TMEM64 family membrane protein n=2 Tax=Aequorivita TaxID=153265 RepID=A0AB35YZI4_9FLAO|nr:TVP38/TMEM64 family protein [Aequorivita sp. Ant34-E75]WGF93397.1 TVP38/TMEM64 family protein [Aequorivita sp. Ant34-E75]
MTNTRKATKRLPLYLSLIFIAILVVCYFTIPEVKQFFTQAWNVLTSDDEARIQKWVEGFGWFGPLVLVLAMIAQMFLIVIPTILLMIVTILAYGPIWGSLLILIAVFSASSVGYLIGKYVGTQIIVNLLGNTTMKKVSSFLKEYGFWAVVITRVNPFLSNDAISFVAGVLKMNYWRFITATLLGITPLTILIAIVGKNINTLKSGLLWASIGSLILFIIYIWWDKKRKTTN